MASVLYAAESMRLTTRLMQMASWLLLQRAIEYNVLGQTNEAFKDLERALYFDNHSPLLLREPHRGDPQGS